jgi:hypothetical protein
MPEAKVALLDLQPRAIKLQRGAQPGFYEGSYSLTLSNARGVPFTARVEIRPEGDTKAEWLSIPEDRKLFDFPADKTQPIPIKARVPEAAAGKTLRFTVKVMDQANTDELYDTLDAEMSVPAPDGPKPAPSGGLPKWLIPVIIGVVLVLGGVGFGIYKLVSSSGKGATAEKDKPTDTNKPRPNPPAVVKACQVAKDCESQVCNANHMCAPPYGICANDSGCPERAQCVGGHCRLPNGHRCTTSLVCISEYCFDDKCAANRCPTCPAGQICNSTSAGPRCGNKPQTDYAALYRASLNP